MGINGTAWNQGFINNITTTNITPTTNGGRSLGINGTAWNQGFINNITATNITPTSNGGGSLGISDTRCNEAFINNITTTSISVSSSISIPDNSINGSKISGNIAGSKITGTITNADITIPSNIQTQLDDLAARITALENFKNNDTYKIHHSMYNNLMEDILRRKLGH